jgi:hypothetical protein
MLHSRESSIRLVGKKCHFTSFPIVKVFSLPLSASIMMGESSPLRMQRIEKKKKKLREREFRYETFQFSPRRISSLPCL